MPSRPTAPPPRPLILINTDLVTPKGAAPASRLNIGYVDSVIAAGGRPLLLPPMLRDQFTEIDRYLDMVSGVVMTGGLDLDPRRNGQQTNNTVTPMASRREDADRYLLARVVERKLPLLAIGVGMQLLNVHFGGTLHLHLPADNPKAMPHYETGGPHRHMVNVEPKSTLEDIFGAPELRVNSGHHQAVNQVGKRLRVGARAPDGVIEAIETTDESWFCIGVQWHPECDTASALDRQLFDCMVEWAMRYEPAEELAAVA